MHFAFTDEQAMIAETAKAFFAEQATSERTRAAMAGTGVDEALWQAVTRQPVEVICHGDFAPYNCVFEHGELVGVIDFDHAHPGSRAWDLAYALYRFVPIMDATNPDGFGTIQEQCRRARLFCDAYGLTERSRLVETLRLRIESMADFLRQGAAKDDPRMLANIEAGHLAIYLTDSAYVEQHAGELEAALTA